MNTLFLKKVDKIIGGGMARLLPRPARRDFPSAHVERLLLIRPGGIGDAALLAPAIQALRQRWPDAVIHILAESRNAAVFGLCPEVTGVFRYDRPRELGTVLRGWYDVVIDTEQWHRLSAGMARLIRSPVKIGFATNERKRLFTNSVAYDQAAYEVASFLDLLRSLGISPPDRVDVPFLEVDSVVGERAGGLLAPLSRTPFLVLFPGASIPERRWGAENFRQVAAALADQGVPSVVVGGREDAEVGTKIVTDLGGLNLAGKTSLVETAAVIDRCAVLVSGDSGVLHIGVGLDRPTVSLFGPGIAAKWAPRGRRHIVLDKNLPCSPCTRFGYTPPCPHNGRCLSAIRPDEVVEAVATLLARLDSA